MKYILKQKNFINQSILNSALMSEKPSIEIEKLIDNVYLTKLKNLIGMKQNKYHKWDVFGHTMRVLDNSEKKLIIRLAALFHDIGKQNTIGNKNGEITFHGHEDESMKIADEIMSNIGYDKKMIGDVKNLIGGHMELKYAGDDGTGINNRSLRRFKNKHSMYLDNLMSLMDADNKSHGTEYDMKNQITILKNRMNDIEIDKEKTVLPLNGNDIMKIFNVNGKMIGIYLKELENGIELNGNMDKDEAIEYLKNVM